MKFASSFLAMVFVLVFTSTLLAQTSSGVTGTVTDSSGAVVPGATVTLRDTKISREQTTTTNDSGIYSFTNVAPGAGFQITFTATGFQTYVLNDVQIGTARTETHNAKLTAGDVSATVTVAATSGDATLNTTDASLGNIISNRQLKELPIQLRGTPAALIGLQPGAVGNNVFAGGGNRTGSVAGARVDQGNITVDGIDSNDQATGQAFNTVANAPIDSIQEFRAVTSGANSSSGRSAGGQIELTTNSGTNEFHGNLREYYRTEKTAANSFFNNRSKVAIPRLRRHQYGGSLGGPIPMFNFGENDGPMFRSGKDRLFFFFDAEIRQDRSQVATSRSVPLQHVRDGQIAYINNNAGCGATSRIDTTPNCISYLSAAQITAIDPLHLGSNPALISLMNTRYPLPNDLTGGNGVNTGLVRWNAPNLRDDKIYTTRIDTNINDKNRLFFRFTKTLRDSTNSLQFYPGDQDAVTFKDRSYSFASGWTSIVNSSFTNVTTLGVVRQANFFTPPDDTPTGSLSLAFTGITSPYPSLSYQDRIVWTPTLRNDSTWIAGSHSIQFGASIKPIRQNSTLTSDYSFPTIGIGGNTTALPGFRPANIRNGSVAAYDAMFAFMLGRVAAVSTNYNYAPSGDVLPPGTGKFRNYAYDEYEFYAQDNWRINRDLTVNVGVRYHLYPAPYDRGGFQADHTTDWEAYFAKRVANAAAGIASDSSDEFLVYNLSGKGNDGTPLYATDKNNFAPRIGVAWNPSFKEGILGGLFGEKKTVLHGNFSMVYDRVGGGITFIQNQSDYLFQNSGSTTYGNLSPTVALTTDPRLVSISNLGSAGTTAPTLTTPFTPFVSGGVPFGLAEGQSNYTIAKNFEIPYAYTFNVGIQRELPGNMLLDVSYVGRLGRKLFVQSDVSQALNFKDAASGQMMFDAFNAVQPYVAARVAAQDPTPWVGAPAQAWFENQMNAAAIATYGGTCAQLVAVANCTELMISRNPTYVRIGDTSDMLATLSGLGLLGSNVGMNSQFAGNWFITNQGNSDYHAAFLSLQKRFSKGFEFEANYTFSKSLDNNSSQVNTVTGALICDVQNPDLCRGYSDFDIRHLFNANFIMEVPFGRGRAIGGNMNKWADFFVGGWSLSGILSARSGFAINSGSGAFPIGFNLNSPAIVTGDASAFKMDIRDTPAGIQFFADRDAANNALRFPHHGEMGSRNTFRSPNFWGLDMGLSKKFAAPWNENHRFTVRVDAFNVTNTNAFSTPNLTKDSTSFGLIGSSLNSPRELQFGFRFDF
jgi:hypothetical protein